MNVSRRHCAGFSLIEMLIVFALLVILASVYFRASSPVRQRSSLERCEANLKKLFLAQQIYAGDYSGKFPSLSTAATSEEPLDLLVPRYTSDVQLFVCPGSASAPLAEPSLKNSKISYAYYMGRNLNTKPFALTSDEQVNTRAKRLGDAVFSTSDRRPGNNHGDAGGNFLFTDGHVEASKNALLFALPLTNGVVLLNPRR